MDVLALSFSRVSTTSEALFVSDFEVALRVDRFLDLEVGMFFKYFSCGLFCVLLSVAT